MSTETTAFTLVGTEVRTFDDKWRLVLPAKMRDPFANQTVILGPLNGRIGVWEPEGFQAFLADLEQKFAAQDTISEERRSLLLQAVTAASVQGKVDSQHRVTVPVELRDRAKLKNEVKISGVGSKRRLEIWDPEAYDRVFGDTFAMLDEVLGDIGA